MPLPALTARAQTESILGLDHFLPTQDAATVHLMAERFDRDAQAQQPWARIATECVDFVEGRQWSAADLKKLTEEGRPNVTLNKIRPLVMLVLGIFSQNRTDIKFMPGLDDTGSDVVAEVLNKISKLIENRSTLQFVDGEVFMDGLVTGRGYYRTLLDQTSNLLGEVKEFALDPFSCFPDSDGQDYDINKHGHIFYSRWLSLADIRAHYGEEAFDFATRYMGNNRSGMPMSDYYWGNAEGPRPPTRFGGDEVGPDSVFAWSIDRFYDYVDQQRKTLRVLECEHHVLTPVPHFVDIETGDMAPIPDTLPDGSPYDRNAIVRTLEYGQSIGNPLRIIRKLVNKVRWTQTLGDLLLYDDWSIYENYSITGYFPYFRRGMTQGMVEPLIDPQRELNKRHSSRLNILMRAAHGGWIYDKTTLDQEMKERIEEFGSRPGLHIGFDSKGGTLSGPKQIDPPVQPEMMKQMEHESSDNIKEIANINDSALGNLDRVQSGRAIEARTRQSIVGVEPMLVNFRRTKMLKGSRRLELVQRFYKEPRILRITGDDGKPVTFQINLHIAGTAQIVNDITVGKYIVTVDETPASASYLEAQFAEAMLMREKGIPIPDDVILEMSSLGRKPSIQQRVQMVRAQLGVPGTIPAVAAGSMPAATGTGGSPAPGPGGGGEGGAPGAGGPMPQPSNQQPPTTPPA